MRIYGFLNVFDSLLSLTLALIVAVKINNNRLALPFVGWTFSISVWSLGVGMHAFSDIKGNIPECIFWSRFLHYGAVFIPSFYTHFVLELCNKAKKLYLFFCYGISVIFCLIIPSKIFISTVSPIISFKAFPKIGPAYPIFVIFLFSCVISSIVLLIIKHRRSEGLERNQALYMIFASTITYSLGTTAFLPMFNVPVFPFGTPFVFLNAVIIIFTMFRYRLMDFNLIMRWGLAYFILVLTLLAIFVPTVVITEIATKHFFNLTTGFTTLAAVCLVVFIFDPLRKSITLFVDRIIFRSPDFQSILSGFDTIIQSNQPLTLMVENLCEKLNFIWSVEHTGIAIWDFKNSRYKFLPIESFENQSISRMGEAIVKSDFLVRTLETERRLFSHGIVIQEEVTAHGNRSSPGERTTFWKIRRTMRWLGAAACIPLLWEKELIGFIILGKKRNNTIYNDEDKKFLSHLSEKITGAIKDHLTYESNKFD